MSSNPCVSDLLKIKILFALLVECTLELISTPKTITFTPVPPLG